MESKNVKSRKKSKTTKYTKGTKWSLMNYRIESSAVQLQSIEL